MSSIATTFIAVSTVFTQDIWGVLRGHPHTGPPPREVWWVSRVAILMMVGVAMAWVPVIETLNEHVTFQYLQIIQSYIAPSICAVVLMSMLSVRVTEAGALSSLFIGAVLAIVRFSLDAKYLRPRCGAADGRPLFVRLSFLYFSVVVFVV